MNAELFTVENGYNQGVYLKVTNSIPKEVQMKILGKDGLGAGYISSINVGFYKRHGAATNKTLQSISTFEQVATIWRLNPYGMSNKSTLKFSKDKIFKAIELLNDYIENNVKASA